MPKKRTINDPKGFPVQPEHIDTSKRFFEAFDNSETEISAGWIVRFLQEKGEGWIPFIFDDINEFYRREFPVGRFYFNRLVDPELVPPNLARAFAGHYDPPVPKGGGWIILSKDGKYHITDEFVLRCFQSSPAGDANNQS